MTLSGRSWQRQSCAQHGQEDWHGQPTSRGSGGHAADQPTVGALAEGAQTAHAVSRVVVDLRAAEAAREHGVYRTAKVLRLESGKLRRAMEATASNGRPPVRRRESLEPGPATFFELPPPPWGAA
jgi:hypothetical protein